MNTTGVHQVRLTQIAVPERLRRVDPDWVAALADNIGQQGLRQPLTVRQAFGEDGAPIANRYLLVAGAHRLEAVRALGLESVAAEIIDVSDAEARLIEIDENLYRRELSALDRAKFLAEREALYLALHPDTKRGRAGGLARQGQQTTSVSFAEDTAERLGLSGRTVQRQVALWRSLDRQAVALLGLHPVSRNASELARLAKMGPAAQRRVAKALAAGARNVAAALGEEAAPRLAPAEAQFAALVRAWTRAAPGARESFLAFLRTEGVI